MSLEDRKKLSDIYRIEDGIIYYSCADGNEYSREVCKEIVDLLTNRRTFALKHLPKRYLVYLFENEMRAINNYILKIDDSFTMVRPYKKQVLRGYGSVSITYNQKAIK